MADSDKLLPLKPPTTFEEQVQILKGRNMTVSDEQFAVNVLRRVNYYRLSGYMLSFKVGDVFKNGTTFEQVYGVYGFDQKLRNLITGLLERIEISARTCISYYLAHTHGALCYEDRGLFQDPDRHSSWLVSLNKSIDDARRGHELFVEHHDAKYGGRLPIWSIVELMSFGTLSLLYANLKPSDRKRISVGYFGVPQFYLRSWLRALSHVRNVCAHHSRLYNKRLTITPELFPDDKESLGNPHIFAAIFVAGILCPDDSDWSSFETGLEALIDEYIDVIELERIGFPPDWRNLLRDTVSTRRFSAETRQLSAK
ncbi:MAG: Abi family protein [Alicyclobacillus sp.]|nr:Abi family protein [Alicyclobacillus sp.]